MRWSVIVLLLALSLSSAAYSAPPEHTVVFADPDVFAGWPANVGLWSWQQGQEVAVGFVTGKYKLKTGHNLSTPYTNRLARSTDGGKTWKVEEARGFYQPDTKVAALSEAIPFGEADLALRFTAEGYHGGSFVPAVTYSRDRGKTWVGPFALPALVPASDKSGRTEITMRTDYLVRGKDDCLVFGTARKPGDKGSDHAFACRLSQGGKLSEFLGWMPPAASTDRAAMPSTVLLAEDHLLSAVRARKQDADVNWIEGFRSTDGGREWKSIGRIGDTGSGNGNPPALLRLSDGRLACAYGDRKRQKLFLRLSADEGKTWGDEVVLRDDYHPDTFGDKDFGYPRAFQRRDGDIVVLYYWATRSQPVNFIAATSWSPPKLKP